VNNFVPSAVAAPIPANLEAAVARFVLQVPLQKMRVLNHAMIAQEELKVYGEAMYVPIVL
jgi:hypothetical protein